MLGLTLTLALLCSGAAPAEVPDPRTVAEELAGAALAPELARQVDGLTLDAGMAQLRLREGLLFPAVDAAGRPVEMVFVGDGTVFLDPPDPIEAGQLELFTGEPRLEEEITGAVLVLAMDQAVAAVLDRPRATAVDPAVAEEARATYRRWRESPERRQLSVDAALLLDTLDDPLYDGYFAGWFQGRELHEFLYVVAPEETEQITLGRFEPVELSDKERRRASRRLARNQRKGKLIGLSVEDLGDWDTWVSLPASGPDGRPAPGRAAFEPEHYELEVSIARGDLTLTGKARLTLRATTGLTRAVRLALNSDLQVSRVSDGEDAELFFQQDLQEVVVYLPRIPPAGETVTLEVAYAGNILEKIQGKTHVLRDTQSWYPRPGDLDLATYDVTFHWPAKLDLLAAGRRVDGGEDGGERWERRTLDLPVYGFSFEVGRLRTVTGQAGHVRVTVAIDAYSYPMLADTKDDLLETVCDALAYFEEIFGPYPLDELTVVTAPRYFSQAMLGFVTLSGLMMADDDFLGWLLEVEDRRTVIAHELAHQWWGHLVGWESYRDQWISEAMANYAALLYARNRLGGEARFVNGPTRNWQDELNATLTDGRPVDSLGPLVLGVRLASGSSYGAYQSIVYKKGAVVLDMLARRFGEETFIRILGALVKAVSHRTVSTASFLELIERITDYDLDAFARQFIYGTGLPEIYYTYDIEPAGEGLWRITGSALQQTPYHFRYRVVERDGGRLDVAREGIPEVDVSDWKLTVPVQVTFYDPAEESGKRRRGRKKRDADGGDTMILWHTVLSGERTDFSFELPYEPLEFWFDRYQQAYGRFYDQSREPKRMLYYQGLNLAAAGLAERADETLRRALAAEVSSGPGDREDQDSDETEARQRLDARIRLRLARLHLDAGRLEAAREELELTRPLVDRKAPEWLEEQLAVLEGDYEAAFKRLEKLDIERTDGQLLLAIAARQTGRSEELEKALEAALEAGADVSLLE